MPVLYPTSPEIWATGRTERMYRVRAGQTAVALFGAEEVGDEAGEVGGDNGVCN